MFNDDVSRRDSASLFEICSMNTEVKQSPETGLRKLTLDSFHLLTGQKLLPVINLVPLLG